MIGHLSSNTVGERMLVPLVLRTWVGDLEGETAEPRFRSSREEPVGRGIESTAKYVKGCEEIDLLMLYNQG